MQKKVENHIIEHLRPRRASALAAKVQLSACVNTSQRKSRKDTKQIPTEKLNQSTNPDSLMKEDLQTTIQKQLEGPIKKSKSKKSSETKPLISTNENIENLLKQDTQNFLSKTEVNHQCIQNDLVLSQEILKSTEAKIEVKNKSPDNFENNKENVSSNKMNLQIEALSSEQNQIKKIVVGKLLETPSSPKNKNKDFLNRASSELRKSFYNYPEFRDPNMLKSLNPELNGSLQSFQNKKHIPFNNYNKSDEPQELKKKREVRCNQNFQESLQQFNQPGYCKQFPLITFALNSNGKKCQKDVQQIQDQFKQELPNTSNFYQSQLFDAKLSKESRKFKDFDNQFQENLNILKKEFLESSEKMNNWKSQNESFEQFKNKKIQKFDTKNIQTRKNSKNTTQAQIVCQQPEIVQMQEQNHEKKNKKQKNSNGQNLFGIKNPTNDNFKITPPPYTLNGDNDLKNINPYAKFQQALSALEGPQFYKQQSFSLQNEKQPKEICNKHQESISSAKSYLKLPEKISSVKVKSGSIKRPSLSSNFYVNAKLVEQACVVKPFFHENNQQEIQVQTSHRNSQTKTKLLKLIGKKRKFDVMIGENSTSQNFKNNYQTSKKRLVDSEGVKQFCTTTTDSHTKQVKLDDQSENELNDIESAVFLENNNHKQIYTSRPGKRTVKLNFKRKQNILEKTPVEYQLPKLNSEQNSISSLKDNCLVKFKQDISNNQSNNEFTPINPISFDQIRNLELCRPYNISDQIKKCGIKKSENDFLQSENQEMKTLKLSDQAKSVQDLKDDASQKCQSIAVQSFVSRLLKKRDNQLSSVDRKQRIEVRENVEKLNEKLKTLRSPDIQKIQGFAMQINAIKQIKGLNCYDYDNKLSSEISQKIQNIEAEKEQTNRTSLNPTLASDNITTSQNQITPNKLSVLKRIKKDQLEQLGYGNVAQQIDQNEFEEQRFLSETSLQDSDFKVLMQDDFCENISLLKQKKQQKRLLKENRSQVTSAQQTTTCKNKQFIWETNKECMDQESTCSADTVEIKAFQLPQFNPNINYEDQFYEMFIANQNLLEELDYEAREKLDIETKIYKIQDFYERHVSKMTDERDQNGRKIHKRKTMAELDRGFVCPYDTCGNKYASEGSLNLHIKRKHNGGNKTDREKKAKALIIRLAKGHDVIDQLDLNLPPGIIRKVSKEIESLNQIRVPEELILQLEQRIMEHNKIDEKRQKELELQRAAIESERAARLVEERQCTPPKKSRILERHKLRNNGDTLMYKQFSFNPDQFLKNNSKSIC